MHLNLAHSNKGQLSWLILLCLIFAFPNLVSGQLSADFTANQTFGCSPLVVNFTDQSTGNITSRTWKFGNNNQSVGNSTQVTASYTTPGTYDVTLIISDGNQVDSIVKTNYITVFENPIANFNFSTPTGCVSHTVNFTDLSTPGDAPINSWSWSFGDGSPVSNLPNPTHTYSNPGIFTVSLTVADGNGCNDTKTITGLVQVSTGPTAAFSASGPTSDCNPPLTVNFVNNSTGIGNLTYWWDLGTTTSTQANPSNTYTQTGTYDITLAVTDPYGCTDTLTLPNYVALTNVMADFTLQSDTLCPYEQFTIQNNTVGATNYIWDFGDGSGWVSDPNPTHFYTTPGTYVITLIAQSGPGCTGTYVDTVVVEEVFANFTSTPHYSCDPPEVVQYTDSSSANVVAWEWHFGNPTNQPALSFQQNPSHLYASMGVYDDTLIVTTAAGCKDTIIKPANVIIFELGAFFEADTTEGCVPLTVDFTDLSSPFDSIASWSWDFGDSSAISNVQNPTHTFVDTGTFNVVLTVTTPSGCEFTHSVEITVGQKPIANFTFSDTVVCASDSVQFTDLSTDPLLIDEWIWSFGDSLGTGDQNPKTDFNDTGYIDVTLIVKINGCADTLELDSAIYLLGPALNFTPVVNCENPYEVEFQGQVMDATSFYWDFGDNSPIDSVNSSPVHTYSSTGIYTVVFSAVNVNTGCTFETEETITILDVEAEFTLTDTIGCGPLTVTMDASPSQDELDWHWTFGNGFPDLYHKIDTMMTYNYNGTYTIQLIVTDANGCQDTASQQLQVFNPNPDFTVDTIQGCAPFSAQFTDLTQTDTAIAQYIWQFGDGTFSGQQNPLHTYYQSGVYDVQLSVTDMLGCNAVVIKPTYIEVFQPPSYFTSNFQLCEGDSAVFGSVPFGNYTYQWDFGDNTSSNQQFPIHSYANPGLYSVSLTVTDSIGCDSTYTVNNHIHVQATPTASFVGAPTDSNCYPLPVSFTATSTSPFIATWTWDFGIIGQPPITLTGPLSNYTYTLPGSYDVSLAVTTTYGCTDTLLLTDFINIEGPVAAFAITDDTVCIGEPVEFVVTQQLNVEHFNWDFGDGNDTIVTSSVDTVYHTYYQTGALSPVMVYVDSSGDCPKFDIDDVFIHEVIADFSLSDSVGCEPLNVNVTDQSIGATNWYWNFGNTVTDTGNTAAVTYANAGVYNIRLIPYNDSTQCLDTTYKQVVVNPTPVVQTSPDQLICRYDSVKIQASGGVHYQWSPPEGLSHPELPVTMASPDSSQSYGVLVTDQNGCTNTGSVWVEVQQWPQFFFPIDTSLFFGQALSLALETTEPLIVNWSPGDYLSCTNCPDPIIDPEKSITYTLTIQDQYQCFKVDTQLTVLVEHDHALHIPNAFTPNGDGVNDVFYVVPYGMKDLVSLRIYNRWGEQVFFSGEFNYGWDGIYKGLMSEAGVYPYVVWAQTWTGQLKRYEGMVVLVR